MNTVQKIQKLNEMATTLIETEDMVDKIEQKLLLKNPSEKQKAEKIFTMDIEKVKKAETDEDVKLILKSNESLSKLPDNARINIMDASIYIYSYFRRLGHGKFFSYLYANYILTFNVIKYLIDGDINKEQIIKIIKDITDKPKRTYLLVILKNYFSYIIMYIAAIATIGLFAVWLLILSYKYIKKMVAADIANYDLEYKLEPEKQEEPLSLPPAIEETINVMYNKYKKLQLIS